MALITRRGFIMSWLSTHNSRAFAAAASLLTALIAVGLSAAAQAQSSQTLRDGYTPTGLEQGAPAGSYQLSGFESVNPYNGNLGVALPLAHVGGRGSAGYTMTLPIDLHWEVLRGSTTQGIEDDALFRAGEVYRVGYSPGFLLGTSVMDEPVPFGTSCPPTAYRSFLTRLRFIMPDGTEVQLHDKKYQGAPVQAEIACNPTSPNRGKVFVTADGESMTFISDADILDTPNFVQGTADFYPSGVLLMKDGTRYRIDGGKVSWIRDRNGNKVAFTYETTVPAHYGRLLSVKDSLNRQISITYATTSTGYDEITFAGFGGTARSVKVWYSALQNILRPDFALKKYNELFPDIYSYSLYTGDYYHNPALVSKVELPDNRAYQFYYNSYGEVARVILPTGGGLDYEYAGLIYPLNDVNHIPMILRRCHKRTVYNTLAAATLPLSPPSGTVEKIESYVRESSEYIGPTVVRVEHYSGANTLLAQEKHYYYGYPFEVEATSAYSPVAYSPWPSGKEYKTESFDIANGVAGSALRRAESVWSPTVPSSYPPAGSGPAPNPKIAEAIKTLVESNQVAKQTFDYDQYNNRTDVYEYGYGTGAAGALVRRTHTDYLTSAYDTIVGGITAPDAAATIHIRSLPTQQQVYDAGGVLRAQTGYEYDNYNQSSSDAFHANLTDRAGISGLVSRGNVAPGPSYGPTVDYRRGNVTQTTRYLLNSSGGVTGSVSGWAQYDVAGNMVKTIDPRSTTSNIIATTFDFADRFGSPNGEAQANDSPPAPGSTWLSGQATYAFPTKVTNALGHIAYTQFDYFLGKPIDSEDPNGVKSSLYYNDALDRPTQSRSHVTGSSTYYSQKTISYDDANRVITTSSDKDTANDNVLTGKAYYDGLGRTYRTAAYEGNTGVGNTWAITATQFDALGRTWRVANPFRAATPDAALPTSPQWTTTTYDALSRVTEVKTPDDAKITTVYSGNQVTVTDPAVKVRRSFTDALGRLTQVVEDPSGLNYSTTYGYDALANLTSVTQDAQTRTFVYDSLARLTSATNPESGTMTYGYDAGGNLLTKTDARGITTSYQYDALNRNTWVTYSSYPNYTAAVERKYDGAPNGKGRLWYDVAYVYGSANTWLKGPAGESYSYNLINGYDALGRTLSRTQHFLVYENNAFVYKPYTVARTYNLAGAVTTQTYPSNRTVNYAYDAAGRLQNFTGNLGNTSWGTVNYAADIRYNVVGQMTREQFGTVIPLWHHSHYNIRHQLYDTRVGTSSYEWSWNRGWLAFLYSATAPWGESAADNNGNILRADHWVPKDDTEANWETSYQRFWYDGANRLDRANEVSNTSSRGDLLEWNQDFDYDRFGNRTINAGGTESYFTNGQGQREARQDIINELQFAVRTARNQLRHADDDPADPSHTSNRLRYDAVGNLVFDNYTQAEQWRGYDAENRIQTIKDCATCTERVRYGYDADGKRVKRLRAVGASWAETWQVYGLDGELVAEYDKNASPSSPQKEYGYRAGQLLVTADSTTIKWAVADHLGTPRMIIDKNGALLDNTSTSGVNEGVERHDYLPFGEELFAGLGIRHTTTTGYAGDSIRQKFTGYERDTETGLDFAQARYFSNVQGRFTSPDSPLVGQVAYDPQTWNLYSYTSNNPLGRLDPDGRRWFYRWDNNQFQIQWVNPNSDGSYTSPGTDWSEFVPTANATTLTVDYNGNTYMFGETNAGAPEFTRITNTNGLEDATLDLALSRNPLYDIPKRIHDAIEEAKSATPGPNPYDPDKIVSQIADLKNSWAGSYIRVLESNATLISRKNSLRQYARSGGVSQANADFDALARGAGAKVNTYPNGTRAAEFPDGTRINVRAQSTFNEKPTLEVQKTTGQGKDIKFRYDP
jgi:RHS repeat-associated protein